MTISFSVSVTGNLQLSQGQKVDFNTPLARYMSRDGFQLLIAQELGIPNDKIFMHISKIVGDTVEANEILATKKTTFGTKKISSPKPGIIKQIDHETGTLYIETLTESSDTKRCYFEGVVRSVKDSVVTLEVKSADKFTLKDVVDDFGGEILHEDSLHLAGLVGDAVRNKVVFTESIKPAEAVRLDVLGASGIVTKEEIVEKAGVNTAELGDKNDWAKVSESKHTHCVIDKKNATMYLYSL